MTIYVASPGDVDCGAAAEEPWKGKVEPESEQSAALHTPGGFFLAARFVFFSVNQDPCRERVGDATGTWRLKALVFPQRKLEGA